MDRPKILLADDSITIRKVVELTFADEGIDVMSVSDGDAAMSKFVEAEPDLVIADVHMPGISGYQICEMIKQDESTMNIPVILLVGSFEEFDAGEASRVGSNYYFTKPFRSIRELVDKVKEYLAIGAFDATAVETTDIDDLYVQSISETAHGIGDHSDEIDSEPPNEISIEPVFESQAEIDEDLGDAGMDDELIETIKIDSPTEDTTSTEPSSDEVAFVQESDVNSVTELPIEESPESENDEIGLRGIDVDSDENVSTHDDEAGSRLKFMIDDVDDSESVVQEEEPTTQFSHSEIETNENEQSAVIEGTTFSPELIEIVAARVIEKLSDQAVREAAREAVPKIAEKLIREALGSDGSK